MDMEPKVCPKCGNKVFLAFEGTRETDKLYCPMGLRWGGCGVSLNRSELLLESEYKTASK